MSYDESGSTPGRIVRALALASCLALTAAGTTVALSAHATPGEGHLTKHHYVNVHNNPFQARSPSAV